MAQHMDAEFWDERYRSRGQLFSGNPNGVLVAEAAGLPPGRALDVGAGEGADAIWLARRGWQVTGADISRAALERAAAAATDVADRVSWTQADLTAEPPPDGPFDLVSVQYFPLPRREPDHTALRRLLGAVAPGGTLLFVSHDLADLPERMDDGVVPGDYYQPAEIAQFLDGDWTDGDWAVLVNETRLRAAPGPEGTHHTHDTVLRARRLR